MRSKPPFIAQERSDSCMLACLRVVRAFCGVQTTEAALAMQVSLVEGGLDPSALANLAQHFGLKAEACQLDLPKLAKLTARQQFPIVLLDRSVLDQEFSIHAVIPIRCVGSVARRTATTAAEVCSGISPRGILGDGLGKDHRLIGDSGH